MQCLCQMFPCAMQYDDKPCAAGTGCQKPSSGVCDPANGDCSYTGDAALCTSDNQCKIEPTCNAVTGGCTV